MVRRVLGALICALLFGVSASTAYAEAGRKRFAMVLEIETSYFSLDSFDDVTDVSPRGGTMSWSSRDKSASQIVLGAKVRKIKFAPSAAMDYESAAPPRPAAHDILRFQEVFRI